jgi:hypothetical protein
MSLPTSHVFLIYSDISTLSDEQHSPVTFVGSGGCDPVSNSGESFFVACNKVQKRGQDKNDCLLRKHVRFSRTPEVSVQLLADTRTAISAIAVLSSYYTFAIKVFLGVSFHINLYCQVHT